MLDAGRAWPWEQRAERLALGLIETFTLRHHPRLGMTELSRERLLRLGRLHRF